MSLVLCLRYSFATSNNYFLDRTGQKMIQVLIYTQKNTVKLLMKSLNQLVLKPASWKFGPAMDSIVLKLKMQFQL